MVALCRFVDVPVAEAVAGARLVAICADVRDPGNAGTVIRCADAAGADGVVLAGSSVDAYNPKTVRASVGSLFHLPLAVEPSAEAAVRAAKDAGLTVLAADGAGEVGLYDAPLAGPTAWLFGNEAWGLPAELAALADHRVAIPIHGRAESLNLSTAAALCLYESARARRASPSRPPRHRTQQLDAGARRRRLVSLLVCAHAHPSRAGRCRRAAGRRGDRGSGRPGHRDLRGGGPDAGPGP